MFKRLFDSFKKEGLKISPIMKVKSLKKEWENIFSFSIRVYNGARFADDSMTLGKIRMNGKKGGSECTIKQNMTVGEVEDMFEDKLGVKIQIENKQGDLADDSKTLGELERS